jgi:hypothetical protein
MPVVRVQGEGEGESLGQTTVGQPTGLSGDVARVANNLILSDQIGRFIAGQVAGQFQEENLADTLKGKNQIMISGSWG